MLKLFDPARKNISENIRDNIMMLVNQAKTDKNKYYDLLDYLADLFKKNPNNPEIGIAISDIRSKIWPKSAQAHFLLDAKINPDTFQLLKANYRKFSQNFAPDPDHKDNKTYHMSSNNN